MKKFNKFECDFIIENVIKESAEKSVYGALMKRNISTFETTFEEKVVIIKILKTSEREIMFLTSLKHQGIPKLLMMWVDDDYIVIIQEKITGLNLFDYLNSYKNIPNSNRIMMAYNLAKILAYLHKGCGYDIIHGDISPNNILISNMDELYLIDFGSSFSKAIVKREKFYYGTKGYFSPKLIETPMSVDKGVDIYSFSMILKLLGIDKISIEGYELYKKCLEKSYSYDFDIELVMEELLYILN
ncbi:MAG: protein kinase [Acidaminobacteraceae bacterium]